jgi:hypothetical protein
MAICMGELRSGVGPNLSVLFFRLSSPVSSLFSFIILITVSEMGIDTEMFVYPERISEELMCPICHCVVERPVQTPSEHLFCEDELLEWMLQSDMCPVTNEPLDPNSIRKPGRIITNMLSALERYCPNKANGCTWHGQSDRLGGHLKECESNSKAGLLKQIEQKDTLIALLRGKISVSEERIVDLEEQNSILKDRVATLQKKVKVYDAFFNEGSRSVEEPALQKRDSKSDTRKLSELRDFESRTKKVSL